MCHGVAAGVEGLRALHLRGGYERAAVSCVASVVAVVELEIVRGKIGVHVASAESAGGDIGRSS